MNPIKKIVVKGIEINISSAKQNDQEYISLTDIARHKNPDDPRFVIQNWMKTRFTVEFLGHWEILYNVDFKRVDFDTFKNEAGSNTFVLTPEKWVKATNAIGIESKRGRHHGGTFAHKDIAFEFASWISPEFKLYLIKEFQRLKEAETKNLSQEWNVKRILTKINYQIHTDAIKEHLIPENLEKHLKTLVYATEADLLNLALFGLKARDWHSTHQKKKGNIRDHATIEQLVILANLETLNAEFITQQIPAEERLKKLNEIAIRQMRSLLGNPNIKKLSEPKSR